MSNTSLWLNLAVFIISLAGFICLALASDRQGRVARCQRSVRMTDKKPETTVDRVYQGVYEAICKRSLRPGMKLGEASLAELFNVSRTSVRAALKQLEADGLVTTEPNKGASVSLPSNEELRSLFETRRLIEIGIVTELCRRKDGAAMQDDLVRIFILPPSMEELEKRLRGRATDSNEVIEGRMARAAGEIAHWDGYDYVLINDDVQGCFEKVQQILAAERMKRRRQKGLIGFVRDLAAT